MNSILVRDQQIVLQHRLQEKSTLIQVLFGPRQIGKTTMAQEIFNNFDGAKLFISADDPQLYGHKNLNDVWSVFQNQIKKQKALLIIDEIHKFPGWADIVKSRWDQAKREKLELKVIILGSAPLLIQKGLTESLAGRFEIIPVPHWSYHEMTQLKSMSINDYIFFGSYPGALEFSGDLQRWKSYIKNSLIETTISRDIMLLSRIDKPALLRQLFFLACEYSGQVLSYQKMTGQLQDAGNTTTLAHYLDLLDAVGFVKGLKKFSGSKVLTRSSSPKLQVYNTALMSAMSDHSPDGIVKNASEWGRWVESAVGAYLLNLCHKGEYVLEYWKDGNYEVDFVLRKNKLAVAIEVKSGRKKETVSGLLSIKKVHKIHKTHIVGDHQGIPLDEFFNLKAENLF